MRTIKSRGTFVVAKPDEADKQTLGGIMLGELSREAPKTAVVLSMGSSVDNLKEGDRIIYKDYTTTEIKLDGETYAVLDQEDILGTIIEAKG